MLFQVGFARRQGNSPFENEISKTEPLAQNNIKEEKMTIDFSIMQLALGDTQRDITKRMEGGRFSFLVGGPNVDGCYYWRVDSKNQGSYEWGAGQQELTKQQKDALELGLVSFWDLSYEERRAVGFANWQTRQEFAQKNKHILVPKHFPGDEGGKSLETTEEKMVEYPAGYKDWEGRSFKDVIDAGAKAMMTSHGSYPKIAKDIKKLHPEINSLLGVDVPAPATFSPYIVEGYLKKELGFTGIVIADWLSMESVGQFFDKYSSKMPKEVQKRGYFEKCVIFGVDAGVNLLFGIGQPDQVRFSVRMENEHHAMENWAKKNPKWMEKLNGSVQFIINWGKENIAELKDWVPPKVQEISFGDKLLLITGQKSDNRLSPLQKFVRESQFSDLWNRQGLLVTQTRVHYTERLTGKRFAGLNEYDNPKDWLKALWKDTGFSTTYSQIDWNNPNNLQNWDSLIESMKNAQVQK